MSYKPRHLKAEPSVLSNVVGRRGAAVIASAAVLAPAAASMETADAAAPAATVTTAAAVKTATYTANVTVLHYGSTGSLVKTLQSRLHVATDGQFGPRTLRAVKNFQRSHRLSVDGYVGPRTWQALGGFPKSTSSKPASKATTSRSNAGRSGVLGVAYRYTGTPYRWGGTTPSGFDCSGFTQYVFRQLGYNLPRTASAQQNAVTRVSNPQPGDLVFTGYPASHVGIYVGNGQIIDSRKPGTTISVHQIWGARNYGRVG